MQVHGYAGSYQITDQAYLVNGDAVTISVPAISLNPPDLSLEAALQYAVVRKSDAAALPLPHISFSAGATLDFAV